jgi:hypothetical protein
MAFVDGEPIDAAKLGELETKVNNLAASIPKIGVSNTAISVTNNSTVTQTVSIPQIQAGASDAWDLKAGLNEKPIKFPEPFGKTPKILVSSRMNKDTKAWHPQVSVAYGASATGFVATVFMPSTAPIHRIYVDYIAIAY